MNTELLEREYRREYVGMLHFEMGLSRGMARKAAAQATPDAIAKALPLYRKLIARTRAAHYERTSSD
ncbi:hypothetical protein [Ottowia sp. VDI28]|uniref:hypothetical protein n=1 Tax=Ottowia sp. VDI28 TaxID=3133968 RepID=UPI003C2BE6BC